MDMHRRNKIDITGNLSVIIGIILFCIWYFYDVHRASNSLENLIFIAPLTILTLLILLIELIVLFKNKKKEERKNKERSDKEIKDDTIIYKGMAVFAGFIMVMNTIGFDLATFFFMTAFMFVQGERKVWLLIGYSLVFSFLVTFFFSMMLPYPMPTVIPFK